MSLRIQHLDTRTTTLTFDRPDRRNALTLELMERFCTALEELATDPVRRVAIVRGAGPVFCAGLDLHEAADAGLAEEGAHRVARTFELLATSPIVSVAAAHGAAYGGGAGLMACCDLVVASDDLSVAFPEVRRGLVPAIVSAALYRRIPHPVLRELLLTGEPIDARRAREVGLVHRVVPRERLDGEVERVVASVLQGAPGALRRTKTFLNELQDAAADEAARAALQLHREARHGLEAAEGFAAFLERRAPQWPETQGKGPGRMHDEPDGTFPEDER